jgi:ribosomal 50S subunit-associated protein YjgA (DUF615 family)
MRAMSARNDDTRSARQIARSKQRKAGDRSTKLANELMKLGAPAVKKLEIDADLREVLERQLAKIHEHSNADAQHFQVAEHWRARLIEEGIAALATFPGAPAARGAGAGVDGEGAGGHDADGDGGSAGGHGGGGGHGADGGADDEGDGAGGRGEWTRLIAAARRERDTGKPPGAARALFRHIVDALKTQQAAAEHAVADNDEADDDDAGDDD